MMADAVMEMSVLLVCCAFSFLSFIISVVLMIMFIAKDKSTHRIEYRNFDGSYEDEVDLKTFNNRMDNKSMNLDNDDYDPDAHSPDTIKDMNKFINDNEVII